MTTIAERVDVRGLPLSVSGLSAGYGGPPVLKDVSIEVAPGEVVALLGANGAGKTTLARAVSGFAQITSGSVRLGENSLVGMAPHRVTRAGVGQVPEGRRLFPGLSVQDNLWLPHQWQRLPEAESRAQLEAVFARFPRLEERRAQRAGSLSGGEQQMLAMARALLLNPRLLLLDEPSTGLAPLFVAEIFAIVDSLRRDLGVSILLIEQNVAGALRVSDRGYVLKSGRIVAEGRSADLAADDTIQAYYLGR